MAEDDLEKIKKSALIFVDLTENFWDGIMKKLVI